MGEPARRRATYDELSAVPDPLVAEIIHGSLLTHPRPGPKHARAALVLSDELVGPFDRKRGGPGGWIFLPEPELHFEDGDVLVPDLAGWLRERMPSLPASAYIALAPDWVCEVLSPSTEDIDRNEKMPRYARAGARHLWLVDPRALTLETHRLHEGQWRLAGTWRDSARVRAEPFEAVEIELGALWGV